MRDDEGCYAARVLALKVAIDTDDFLDDGDRAALHAALDEGIAQDDAGDTVDADDVIAHLRARASLK